MRRFTLKILFFFFPILILSICAEYLLRRIPNEYSVKKEFLDKNASEIKFLILGSSHAYRGLNPTHFSEPTFNSAMFSQTLDYDLKIIEKYKNDLENLNTIIVPISYFTLFSNIESGVENWRMKNYVIYYDFYNHLNFLYTTEILSSPLKKNIERLKDFYLLNKDSVAMMTNGWSGINKTGSLLELQKSGVEAATRHTINNTEALELNKNHLHRLISLASEKKWRIVLVVPPSYETYYNHLSNSQLLITLNHCDNISKIFPHVSYLNLLCSSEFEKEDFYDADHLNILGAQKFTIILDDFITKLPR